VNPGMGSWLPLQARLAEAEKLGTVLVLGATDITGYLAVQNALLLGAERVIGAGRSESGLARAEAAGARTVALTGDADSDVAALAGLLDAGGPMVVLDFVWGPVAEAAFRALASAKFGEDDSEIKYVQIGSLAGLEAAVPSTLLRSRKVTISGSGAGSVSGADIRAQIPRYIDLIGGGSVDVPFRTFPLSDIGTAWTESAKSGPRVVVVPG
jgi:NADPH:quinone reductase-like Zn-dependent oxidoreductase